MTDTPTGRPVNNGILKSPLDFGSGLFLIGIALLGFVGGFGLPFGQLSGIGSGLMPKSVAVLVGAFGLLLVAQGLFSQGDVLEAWSIRGPVFVLGGVLVFAFTIRSLGLVVAGPLAVMVSSLADRDTRLVELPIFAVILTLACGLLFKELLNLPIPFDPAGLIPDPVFRAYLGAKGGVSQLFMSVKSMIVR